LLVVLEGESLFNDASALLIFRIATAAALSGLMSGWNMITTMLFVTIGSIALGLLLSRISLAILKRINDVPISLVVQFCTAFAVWILAERLHLSGIITIVVFATAAARNVPKFLRADMRIPMWSVWEVAVFILNVLAFVLVGFQLKSIVARTSSDVGYRYLLFVAVVCLAVISARVLWVFVAYKFRRRPSQRKSGRINAPDIAGISPGGAAVVAWSGMRGTVTLATALALPVSFPYRDLILASAFGVTLGTLVIQGLTLGPLMSWLKLEDDGLVDNEVQVARLQTLAKALRAIKSTPETTAGLFIQESLKLQLDRARSRVAVDGEMASDERIKFHRAHGGDESTLLETIFKAQREELSSLRANNIIGDTAFQIVEGELDWMELGWVSALSR
jgi:CPA1 family monovalent cation:H+ antiporter